jgi:hypothetical protein
MITRMSVVDMLESLSDSQVAEMGLRYSNKAKFCHRSSTKIFIEVASKCQEELERRVEFRKVNKDMPSGI